MNAGGAVADLPLEGQANVQSRSSEDNLDGDSGDGPPLFVSGSSEADGAPPGTPRTTRKLNLLKTLGISSLSVGRSAEHQVMEDEQCAAIAAISPISAHVSRMVTGCSLTAEPEAALSCLAPAAAVKTPVRISPEPWRSSVLSGASESSPQMQPPGQEFVSPISPTFVPQRLGVELQGMDAEAEADRETGMGASDSMFDPSSLSAVSRTFQRTQWGAMGESVHPEKEASKLKKNEALDKVAHLVRRSRVRAIPLHEAPPASDTVKYVHFMRHGEGTSNSAAREHGHSQYKSEKWKDARLTAQGREQALDVCAYVRQSDIQLSILLVSPLRRAAVTGCIAFYSKLIDRPDIPILAHELLRERAHGNPCDQRNTRGDLEMEVPAVDYSMIDDTDPFANRVGEQGEKWEDTAERSRHWLRWLAKRSEVHVGVATHSAFLLVLFRLILDCSEDLRAWFETGELRSVALIFPEEEDEI